MPPTGAYFRSMGRRPLRMVLEEANKQRAARKAYMEQQSLNEMMRVEGMRQRMEEQIADAPEAVKAMMAAQLEVLTSRPAIGAGEFDDGMSGDSESEIRRRAIEDEAYARPGQFVERPPNGGFILWDFDLLLGSAEQIDFDPKNETFGITSPDRCETLEGPAALAFHRYLYFMGIFAVEDAKRPCPECGNQPPKSCETCGGIGWLIPGPAVDAEFVESQV